MTCNTGYDIIWSKGGGMVKIANCPFCYHRGKMVQFDETGMYAVVCKNCYYTLDVAYPTREIAIQEWNTEPCKIRLDEDKESYLMRIRKGIV